MRKGCWNCLSMRWHLLTKYHRKTSWKMEANKVSGSRRPNNKQTHKSVKLNHRNKRGLFNLPLNMREHKINDRKLVLQQHSNTTRWATRQQLQCCPGNYTPRILVTATLEILHSWKNSEYIKNWNWCNHKIYLIAMYVTLEKMWF